MQAQLVANNPFAILTAIVAPAILTNACSVMTLGTSNRLGRVVDRTRVVAAHLVTHNSETDKDADWKSQLKSLELRSQMLLRALRCFYAAMGLFAASALISVAGSLGAFYGSSLIFRIGAGLAVASGSSAVLCLSLGSYLMVSETRMAVRSLMEEAQIRINHASHPPGSSII